MYLHGPFLRPEGVADKRRSGHFLKIVMNKNKAKEEVQNILKKILTHDPVYWHENIYIRWGRIEIDLLKIIDSDEEIEP
jgi:hypothetical protein